MSTVSGGWDGPAIVKDGLVLYLDAGSPNSFYPLTAGTTWKDISGLANNGTLTNGPTFNSANGGSIVFDGIDDYGDLGDKDIFTFSDGINDIPFSICVWVKLISYVGTSMFLLSKSQNLSTLWYREWFISHNNTLGLTFAILNPDTSGGNALINRTSVLNLNQWYFLTVTYNANKNNNGMLMYHNAVLQSTTTANSGTYTGMGNTAIPVNMGRQLNDTVPSSSFWLNANISTLLIYRNKVLTASEINQNFQATRARFGI